MAKLDFDSSKHLVQLPAHYPSMSPTMRRIARLEYIELQDGKCHYCSKPLDGEPSIWAKEMKINPCLYPPEFFNHPIHLHHNHETGMTIGAVHCHCNAVLWEYDDE